MEGLRRPAGAGPGDATPSKDDGLVGERYTPDPLVRKTVAGFSMLLTVSDRQWGTKPRGVSQTA